MAKFVPLKKSVRMKVAIVKYNAGNIHSVMHALKRVGVDGILTDNFEELKSADKVIFPGVGEAGTTMKDLQERNGARRSTRDSQRPAQEAHGAS